MAETIKKLDGKRYEVQNEIVRTETVSYDMDVLNENIRVATDVVALRESELATAQKNLNEMTKLRTKLLKVK